MILLIGNLKSLLIVTGSKEAGKAFQGVLRISKTPFRSADKPTRFGYQDQAQTTSDETVPVDSALTLVVCIRLFTCVLVCFPNCIDIIGFSSMIS